MNIKEIINEIDSNSINYENITLQNLQSALQITNGAKIVTLITITVPDLKLIPTQNCPFKYELVKISRINGVVNFNYTNSVNKQREREGKESNFEPQPRKWGTRLVNSPFVSHVLKTGENRLYLEIKIEKSINHIYYQPSMKIVVPEEQVKPFLREKSITATQEIEKEVILRDYNVKNIVCITMNGHGYFIEENL